MGPPFLDIYYDTISVATSIKTNKNAIKTLEIYPNPASEQLFVKLDNKLVAQKIDLAIYNSEGKCIQNISNKIIPNTIVEIDISNLTKGGYFLHVISNENESVGTFVKL